MGKELNYVYCFINPLILTTLGFSRTEWRHVWPQNKTQFRQKKTQTIRNSNLIHIQLRLWFNANTIPIGGPLRPPLLFPLDSDSPPPPTLHLDKQPFDPNKRIADFYRRFFIYFVQCPMTAPRKPIPWLHPSRRQRGRGPPTAATATPPRPCDIGGVCLYVASASMP